MANEQIADISTADALAAVRAAAAKHNGTTEPEPAYNTVQDNTHLAINPKKLELWEIDVFESGNMGNGMLVLARYLVNGNGRPVSPDLPTEPIDELPKAEIARIRNSPAYKTLRRFSVAQLESAMEQIKDGSGF